MLPQIYQMQIKFEAYSKAEIAKTNTLAVGIWTKFWGIFPQLCREFGPNLGQNAKQYAPKLDQIWLWRF